MNWNKRWMQWVFKWQIKNCDKCFLLLILIVNEWLDWSWSSSLLFFLENGSCWWKWRRLIWHYLVSHLGRIEFEEFAEIVGDSYFKKFTHAEILEAFSRFDRNHDGFIEADELKHTLTQLGRNFSMDEVCLFHSMIDHCLWHLDWANDCWNRSRWKWKNFHRRYIDQNLFFIHFLSFRICCIDWKTIVIKILLFFFSSFIYVVCNCIDSFSIRLIRIFFFFFCSLHILYIYCILLILKKKIEAKKKQSDLWRLNKMPLMACSVPFFSSFLKHSRMRKRKRVFFSLRLSFALLWVILFLFHRLSLSASFFFFSSSSRHTI